MSKASIRRSVVGSLVIVALAVIAWSAIAQPGPTPPDSVNGVSGTATDIATGNYHSCAIQAGTGEVVCWGSNDGVLIDTAGQATPPDAVNGVLGTAIDVVANGWHSCAIQTGTGSVICWGWDGYGGATPPDTVNGVLGTATDIAGGYYHTLAIALPEPTATPSGRVAVCHNGKRSISVSANAVTTHLTHGDTLGACP